MTYEWKLVMGSQESKPSEVDSSSSPDYVYIRKNIKRVEVRNDFNEDSVHMWQYNEMIVPQNEYSDYVKVLEAMRVEETVDGLLDTTVNIEDAMCESSLYIEERLSAIEDALCELSEGE